MQCYKNLPRYSIRTLNAGFVHDSNGSQTPHSTKTKKKKTTNNNLAAVLCFN